MVNLCFLFPGNDYLFAERANFVLNIQNDKAKSIIFSLLLE